MSSDLEVHLTDDNFHKEVIEANVPCLVDFWAEWCGPCRMIAPTVAEIAKQYQGKIKVGKVNVDEASQVSSDYGIMSIPTLALFKNGDLVDKMVGAVPKAQIEGFIKPHIS
jgi:thioredoxin 1